MGTMAICSCYPDDPLYSEAWLAIHLFTFPVTIISFAYRFATKEPLYPVFIIQFIVFLISCYLVDLILRNYSDKHIERKRIRFIAQQEKEFAELITEEQVNIYLKYGKNIEEFRQMSTPEEKAILSNERWYTIDNMANDILLIKRKQVSASIKDSIERRIKDKLRDQSAMNLLYTIE